MLSASASLKAHALQRNCIQGYVVVLLTKKTRPELSLLVTSPPDLFHADSFKLNKKRNSVFFLDNKGAGGYLCPVKKPKILFKVSTSTPGSGKLKATLFTPFDDDDDDDDDDDSKDNSKSPSLGRKRATFGDDDDDDHGNGSDPN